MWPPLSAISGGGGGGGGGGGELVAMVMYISGLNR